MTARNEIVYSWRSGTDEVYRDYEYKRAVRRCVLICSITALIAVCVLSGTEYFPLMLLCCGGIFLFVMVTARALMHRKGNDSMPYEVTEEYIIFGGGKERTFVSFRKVRFIETEGSRLCLHTRFSVIPVYLPPENTEEIRNFIVRRVEEEGRIR